MEYSTVLTNFKKTKMLIDNIHFTRPQYTMLFPQYAEKTCIIQIIIISQVQVSNRE